LIPSIVQLQVGQSVQLTLVAKDASGNPVDLTKVPLTAGPGYSVLDHTVCSFTSNAAGILVKALAAGVTKALVTGANPTGPLVGECDITVVATIAPFATELDLIPGTPS
jgi:hypothetical protein